MHVVVSILWLSLCYIIQLKDKWI